MNDIAWFREKLRKSAETESTDCTPLVEWLEDWRATTGFAAELVPLNSLRGWRIDPQTGDVAHESGPFFGISGVRVTAQGTREVMSWDQPIYTQPEGGVLAMLCEESADGSEIRFLLQAKAEPGNLGILQFAPSAQATWSNLRRAHKGKKPPLSEYLLGEADCQLVYAAEHNEEGGRFWQKSNSNRLILTKPGELDPETLGGMFVWASLGQIKDLALRDNVLNPFVKTIIAPL
ncbi:MAG: NDP-hexose 2,3-dehydratase family protein [Rhodospirillales bacterium]